MSISTNGHLQDDGAATDSGSDVEQENAGNDEYYRPISTSDDEGNSDHPNPNGFFHLHLENGNGISGLDLNDEEEDEGEEEEQNEVEEDKVREMEASISRAFMEDESRRRSPLTTEAASRIVDAMRGVEFRGVPPDWADQVAEEQWVDQLRRLRGESSSPN
ncbi:uncharacterized protein [Typha angustifolia]|uniref:uncharacterized protein n=1 Tax=Typha angustifolia TaxID=59011 RepID=UPI003C2B4359